MRARCLGMENNKVRLDAIINLGMEIARLRDELRRKESTLATFIGHHRADVPGQNRTTVTHRTETPHSIAERIRQYAMANADRPLPIDEIIKTHRTIDAATVRSTVHRMANGGLPGFHAVGRGVYRFDHEQPFADARIGVQHNREAQS